MSEMKQRFIGAGVGAFLVTLMFFLGGFDFNERGPGMFFWFVCSGVASAGGFWLVGQVQAQLKEESQQEDKPRRNW